MSFFFYSCVANASSGSGGWLTVTAGNSKQAKGGAILLHAGASTCTTGGEISVAGGDALQDGGGIDADTVAAGDGERVQALIDSASRRATVARRHVLGQPREREPYTSPRQARSTRSAAPAPRWHGSSAAGAPRAGGGVLHFIGDGGEPAPSVRIMVY